MSQKSTTRHLVLTITAHVVDVYDSHTQGSPEDKMSNPPAHWAKTQHCPPCVGIPLIEADEQRGEHPKQVETCLQHVWGMLDDMLKVASCEIKKQASAWKS